MSKTVMVMATKYRLKVPVDPKSGKYDINGDKEDVYGKPRQVSRLFVEERNHYVNNELWVIDEEASARLSILRDANKIKNAKARKRESSTMADLIDVMATGRPNQPDINNEVDDLKAKLAESERLLSLQLEKSVIKPNKVSDKKESPVLISGDPNPYKGMGIEELKSECAKQGLTFHHLAKEAKLIELLTSNN